MRKRFFGYNHFSNLIQAVCQDRVLSTWLLPLLWSLLPRYEAIWLKLGVEMALALLPSRVLNFEDELLCIWKWFLFLRLESWKVPQMLYCFHVCLCCFRTDMEIMLVCLLSLFSKHRVLCSLFSVVLRKCRITIDECWDSWLFSSEFDNAPHKGSIWEHLSEFLTKPNPFMALIFRKK